MEARTWCSSHKNVSKKIYFSHDINFQGDPKIFFSHSHFATCSWSGLYWSSTLWRVTVVFNLYNLFTIYFFTDNFFWLNCKLQQQELAHVLSLKCHSTSQCFNITSKRSNIENTYSHIYVVSPQLFRYCVFFTF